MWASKLAGVRSSVTVDIVLVEDEGVLRDGGHLGTRMERDFEIAKTRCL
jgi:hypothetical protein